MSASLPIGVFDSGIGGLTVLKALTERLPAEDFLYLGDTARLPYGTKTTATVERYAQQAVYALVRRGVKAIVVACNTASAAALPTLAVGNPGLPVIGVIEPGAIAAAAATRSGRIGVLATEGTVREGAYQRAILRRLPTAQVQAVPATLFEEGWTDGEVALGAARRYLGPLFAGPQAAPDVLVLGCTHFPPLVGVIRTVVGAGVRIVDSAVTTADALAGLIAERGIAAGNSAGVCRFLVTDGEERFARVGSAFLGRSVAASGVERVSLSGEQ
jgi:glutamate racemase